jgi:hypothetical protein
MRKAKQPRVKIAVLDSGVDSMKDLLIKGAMSRKRIRKGWSPAGTSPEHFRDTYGHGTHVTRLLLEIAPLAEIYVAKVCEDKNLDESKVQDIVDVSFSPSLGSFLIITTQNSQVKCRQ